MVRATARGGDTYQINLGRVPALPAREVDRLAVEHVVNNGGLEIKLPDHAQAKPPTPASSPGNGAARIDVTEKILGRDGGSKHTLQSGVRGR